MNSAKIKTFGGLLAMALVVGLAAEPASAGTFVSVSVSDGTYYATSPSHSYYSYTSYSPSYFSYSRVSYQRSYSTYLPTSYYRVSYTSPSYYSRRVYYAGPSYEDTTIREYRSVEYSGSPDVTVVDFGG